MIAGLITIIVLFVVRFPSVTAVRPTLPAQVTLPDGLKPTVDKPGLLIENPASAGAVLLGGTSSAREVSLDSGRHGLEALQVRGRAGHAGAGPGRPGSAGRPGS